jgi:hypothetical protein
MFNKSKIVSCIEGAVVHEVIAPYLTGTDKLNDDFLIQRLSMFSYSIQAIILKNGFDQKTVKERNIYIRKSTDDLYALLPKKLSHLFFSHDNNIQTLAKECSTYCRKVIIDPQNETFLTLQHDKTVNGKNRTNKGDIRTNPLSKNSVNEKSRSLNSVNGISTLYKNFTQEERSFVYEYLARYVTTFNIEPPKSTNIIKVSGCLKRLADNRWWLRRIRTMINQANEKAAILLNLVNSKKQIYSSDITTKNRLTQIARNEQLLSSHYIINDEGQRFSLKEISDMNVSNPEVKKAELINRCRGFEDLSMEFGHDGLFVTITCPSKFHRAYSKSGAKNPKWDGSMPDEAQRYLNKVWSRIRAELKRKNISIYGFRVVEPQHDGTPHWHCLFFTEPTSLKNLEQIIRFYSLQEDGDEKGALENRCDFKKVDPKKNATGYIMKYIVKNIDGKGLVKDKFGNDSITTAIRINAWASCWCIRQFQQIGGASVSVWRELRRLKASIFPDSILKKARVAADTSNWNGYIKAMGGIFTPTRNHPIKLHYDVNINFDTGECSQSYYDGELVTKVKGLIFEGKAFITRTMSWRLQRVL